MVVDELVAILGYKLTGVNKVQRFLASLGKAEQHAHGMTRAMQLMESAMVVGMAAFASAAALKGPIAFESSMSDVNKVLDLTDEKLDTLGGQIIDLSLRYAVDADGIADITAEAAQAGVAFDDLMGFTELVTKGVVAFDLEAGPLGETLAKINSVANLSQEGLELFGDTVNALSNKMSAKAGDILNFARRATGVAPMLSITANELGAVGAAMIAAGVAPETAATGLNALAIRVNVASKSVDEAFESMGTSRLDFVQSMKDDGADALVNLFTNVAAQGDNTLTVLNALVGLEYSDDYAKFVNNPELLRNALTIAGNSAKNAGSLTREANQKLNDTANVLTRTMSALNANLIMISDGALAVIRVVGNGFISLTQTFIRLNKAGAGASEYFIATLVALGFSSDSATRAVTNLIDGFEFMRVQLGAAATALEPKLASLFALFGEEFPGIDGGELAIYAIVAALAALIAMPVLSVLGALVSFITIPLGGAFALMRRGIVFATRAGIGLIASVQKLQRGGLWLARTFTSASAASFVLWRGMAALRGMAGFLFKVFKRLFLPFVIIEGLYAAAVTLWEGGTWGEAVDKGIGAILNSFLRFGVWLTEWAARAIDGIFKFFGVELGAYDFVKELFANFKIENATDIIKAFIRGFVGLWRSAGELFAEALSGSLWAAIKSKATAGIKALMDYITNFKFFGDEEEEADSGPSALERARESLAAAWREFDLNATLESAGAQLDAVGAWAGVEPLNAVTNHNNQAQAISVEINQTVAGATAPEAAAAAVQQVLRRGYGASAGQPLAGALN